MKSSNIKVERIETFEIDDPTQSKLIGILFLSFLRR